MWGQASNAGDAAAGTTGFGTAVLGSMPTTVITMADLARPAVPSVLNVHDRAVYVDSIDAPPPGYVLARRWMRNDPETDVESLTHQANTMMLPKPLPAVAPPADDVPVFPDDSEDYDPEEAVKALKRHWVNVRRYDTTRRLNNLERYKERLKAITSTGVNPVNAAAVQQLLAQQQQQQQFQQQLQQQQAAQMLQHPAAATALGPGRLSLSHQQQQQLFASAISVMQQAAADAQAEQQQQQQLSTAELAALPVHGQQQQQQQHTALDLGAAAVVASAGLPAAGGAAQQQQQQQQQLDHQEQQVLGQQQRQSPTDAGFKPMETEGM